MQTDNEIYRLAKQLDSMSLDELTFLHSKVITDANNKGAQWEGKQWPE